MNVKLTLCVLMVVFRDRRGRGLVLVLGIKGNQPLSKSQLQLRFGMLLGRKFVVQLWVVLYYLP